MAKYKVGEELIIVNDPNEEKEKLKEITYLTLDDNVAQFSWGIKILNVEYDMPGVTMTYRNFKGEKNKVYAVCNDTSAFDEEKVLENFMSLLSDKVFILNSKIKSISFKTLRQKVISYILNEVKQQKSNYIMLNSTKEDISALLGIPRPSLSRELINLRNMSYIEFDRRTIKVLDIEGLEEELFN